jgi:hypothetical protein
MCLGSLDFGLVVVKSCQSFNQAMVARSPRPRFGVNLGTTKAVLDVLRGWHSSDG